MISQMKDIQRIFEYHGAEHKLFIVMKWGRIKVENAKIFYPASAVELIFAYCHVNKRIVVFRIRVARYRRAHCQPYTLLPIVSGLSYEVIKHGKETKCYC